MAGDGADVGTRERPPRASASAKGKSIDIASGSGIVVDLVDGTSSKGTAARGRNKGNYPELVDSDGKTVKLSGPIEYVWSHGEKYKVVGFTCGYCNKNNSGGGATRFMEHLAGVSGSVVAKRIVGQCLSSSGCERNWSTFALIHTKLRNRLSYDKLHKLVYVHYNLKLRIQQYEDDIRSLQDMQTQHEMDSNPFSMLMDAAVFDDRNPIMDWLVNSRSESPPTLDENADDETEFANPSRFIIEEMGLSDEDVAILKETYFPKHVSKKRKIDFDEEESAEDIESDSDQGSPIYVESGDTDSHESEGTTKSQPSSTPLRPRSKGMKKIPVKNLY